MDETYIGIWMQKIQFDFIFNHFDGVNELRFGAGPMPPFVIPHKKPTTYMRAPDWIILCSDGFISHL